MWTFRSMTPDLILLRLRRIYILMELVFFTKSNIKNWNPNYAVLLFIRDI